MPSKPSLKWAKSSQSAAKALGVSRAAVASWLARGAPGKTRRGYDVEALKSWRDANLETAHRVRVSTDYGADLQRLKRAQADLAELKFQIQRGDYVLRSDVLRENCEKFFSIRQAFMALPRSAAPSLFGQELAKIEELLEYKVRNILERLCEMKKPVPHPRKEPNETK